MMTGIGPYTLTHILYFAACIAFACVLIGWFVYVRASRRKQRELVGDNPASKEAGIAAARQAIESKGVNLD